MSTFDCARKRIYLQQFRGSAERIWLEKRRQWSLSFWEFFSHVIIISFVVIIYTYSPFNNYPQQRFDEINSKIPPAFLREDSSASEAIASYNEMMSGPIFIPTFDQYIQLGEYLKPRLGKYRQALKLTANGQSIDNLLYAGLLIFAPDGPDLQSYLAYMDKTSTKFPSIARIVFPSEREAQHFAENYNNVFVMIIFERDHNNQLNIHIRQDYDANPSTNSFLSETFSGFINNYQQYFVSGFLTFQQSVYLWIQSNASSNSSCSAINVKDIAFTPYPAFPTSRNVFYSQFGNLVPVAIILATSYPMIRFAKSIIDDRESGMYFLLWNMGLSSTIYHVAWISIELLIILWLALTFALISKLSFWSNSSFSLIFILYTLFLLAEVAITLFVSILIRNAQIISVFIPSFFFILTLPYLVLSTTTSGEMLTQKLICSIFPQTLFALASTTINNFESLNIGLQFSNLSEGNINVGLSMYILLLDTMIYFGAVVTVYSLDLMWMITSFLKLFKSLQPNDDASFPFAVEVEEELKEREMIRLVAVDKTYPNGFRAVKNVSFSIHENQIFCLLGSNGAGKSTLISMLSGFSFPSEGQILINGNESLMKAEEIRKMVGVCPQKNLLFPFLTVGDHLRLMARVRGLSNSFLEETVTRSIEEVELTSKTHALARTLSGGMKRRLCLAMALIGDPKFVFLDEPTSGMDIISRRAVWELLQRKKTGRMIVLTTHFLDEAEILADRIAIMSEGRLLCVGSSLFLKSRYSEGYVLTLSKSGSVGTMEELESEVKSVIDTASMKSVIANEVVFTIPAASRPSFGMLFRRLNDKREKLGLGSFSLTAASLGNIFLRLLQSSKARQFCDSLKRGTALNIESTQRLLCLPIIQFYYLFQLRGILAIRNYLGTIFSLLIPALLIILSFAITSIQLFPPQKPLPLAANSLYQKTGLKPKIVLGRDTMTEYQSFDSLIYLPTNSINSSQVTDYLLTPSLFQKHRYAGLVTNDSITMNTVVDRQWIITHPQEATELALSGLFFFSPGRNPNQGFEQTRRRDLQAAVDPTIDTTSAIVPTPHTILHNTTCYHCAPMFYGQLLHNLLQTNCGQEVMVINHPLPARNAITVDVQLTLSVISSLFFLIPVSLFAAILAYESVSETVSGVKQQLHLSHVSRGIYWITILLWNLFLYGLLIAFSVFVMQILFDRTRQIFMGTYSATVSFLSLIILGGCAVFPLTHLLGILFTNPTTAVSAIFMIHLTTGFGFLLMYVASVAMNLEFQKSMAPVFRVFPLYVMGEGLIKICTNFTRVQVMNEPVSYLDWDITGRSIHILAIETGIYFILLLIIDSPITYALWMNLLNRWINRGKVPTLAHEMEDVDVVNTRQIVKQLLLQQQRQPQQPQYRYQSARFDKKVTLLLSDLGKVYCSNGCKTMTALQGLCLACYEGDRWGFLGVNGAGKTTTLKILSGELFPTTGCGYIGGKSLLDPATRSMIGYCPQVDPLLDLLTGREMLWYFGKLRGLETETLNRRIEELIAGTDLTAYAKVWTKRYSGGNKRKLCLALALLGDPLLLLLDEPSTGMDIQAKRHMWAIVERMSINRTVILVSHSMEEIEALCTHVVVMNAGQMQSIGTVQQLKHKFGGGYTVEVKCAANQIERCLDYCQSEALQAEDDSYRVNCDYQETMTDYRSPEQTPQDIYRLDLNIIDDGLIKEKEATRCSPHQASRSSLIITVEERHGDFFRLKVDGPLDLARAFEALEQKKEEQVVLDYNISQFSLEQSFLSSLSINTTTPMMV